MDSEGFVLHLINNTLKLFKNCYQNFSKNFSDNYEGSPEKTQPLSLFRERLVAVRSPVPSDL